jgi:RNase H-fold protein (predicted Holliday junction resolvase)
MSEEVAELPESPDVETAFIVYKDFEGAFHATQTLDIAFLVERLATRNDMKAAFQELLDALKADQIASAVVGKINNKYDEESQRKAAAIRQNLLKRDSS